MPITLCGSGKAAAEAGSGALFVKFAAARPGPQAPLWFGRALDACEAFAAERGCARIIAGVNTARQPAYRAMIERGYRAFLNGVAMQRPGGPGYNRPDCFVLDDWR